MFFLYELYLRFVYGDEEVDKIKRQLDREKRRRRR